MSRCQVDKSECFLFYANIKIQVSKVCHLYTLNAHAYTDANCKRPTVSVHMGYKHDQHPLPAPATPHPPPLPAYFLNKAAVILSLYFILI